MFIRIDNDYFNTDHIAAIRPVDDGEDQCQIFITGCSPVDGGFLVDQSLDDVFELIQNARLQEITDMLTAEVESEEKAAGIGQGPRLVQLVRQPDFSELSDD